ncbi:hypothetical protein [Burkholderia lata]|uniref:hypothetical protein n=1 Tax=Burkholderia lata (strain ATCC 17760 / DSM 23089 / LMG 22485 / NCIMB 9086 / R18194 / 383) TaxID=482957 RepID=UPI00158241C3|nr:hypothetical protein [Burkholderia lata]
MTVGDEALLRVRHHRRNDFRLIDTWLPHQLPDAFELTEYARQAFDRACARIAVHHEIALRSRIAPHRRALHRIRVLIVDIFPDVVADTVTLRINAADRIGEIRQVIAVAVRGRVLRGCAGSARGRCIGRRMRTEAGRRRRSGPRRYRQHGHADDDADRRKVPRFHFYRALVVVVVLRAL